MIIGEVVRLGLAFFVAFKYKLRLPAAASAFYHFQLSHKRLAEPVFEIFKRPDAAVAQQRLHFLGLQLVAGDVFVQLEFTVGRCAFVVTVGLLQRGGAAAGANGFDIWIATVGQLCHLVLGGIDNRLGERLDLVHEHLAAELAGLHLLEFVLPIAG